ncbi:ATP-dependent helicase ULS1 [Colletotrichum liriopes]|uniref:ATP-dependent helicase ULS1 n=1 Tax=Colletotrichum liriopes TaxID=708192 RepID=A0AA37GCT0_9PEZI|nr:ATP-dependent helicase ULS1 [Colletotrichum liriopes]
MEYDGPNQSHLYDPLSASAERDDAAMDITEDESEYELQGPATSARTTKKASKRVAFADDNVGWQLQPSRRARTPQEYIANLKRRSERDLKRAFLKQINSKRSAGVADIFLEPPKAKRRRQRKLSTSSPSDPDGPALAVAVITDVVPELGGIPNPDQAKVSKKDRRKQIAAATVEGDSNRHLGSQKRDANLGMTIWGLANVDCVGSSDYKLKGMRTPIRGWQLQAAARMVMRENADEHPHGGILGDQMGMGKTLTSLVLIVGCPPLPQDIQSGCGGTLVVVPGPNVLKEWTEAISRHVDSIQSRDVLVFKKGTNTLEISQIAQYKIVITTYQELVKYPSAKKLATLAKTYGEGTEELQNAVRDIAGPLFDIEWYRVVFDELHTIKNSETQTFNACYRLNSKRVWGLSGTPLINQCKEIFPYVKLIGVEGIETKKDFVDIYKKGPDASKRLDALINLVTIRRSHEDQFLGKQMLEGLPQFAAEVRWVNLSKEEQLIYDHYFDNQTPPFPIVSMAQKRRATSHPYLLEKSFLEKIDNQVIQELIESLKQVEGKQWVYHQIGKRFGRADPENAFASAGKSAPEEAPELTPREIAYAPMHPFGKSAFGGMFSMAHLLEYTIAEKDTGNIKCGACKQKKKSQPMRISECNHVFCSLCLYKVMYNSKTRLRCPTCNKAFDKYDVDPVPTLVSKAEECATEEEGSSEEDSDNGMPRGRKSKAAEKRRKAQKKRERKRKSRRKYGGDHINNLPTLEEEDSSFLSIGVNENGGVPCPGTKLTAAKELILQWQREAPDDKIIIFVEFIKTAVLLGIILNLEDIPFVYLNGKLTSTEKVNAVEAFKKDPMVKILIASMKVGGQALNLTCANRVIQIDSWWNEAAGDQANGRVNRMGQLKPSHAVVIKARGTIDEYITDLQNRKTEEIEHVLQDDGRITEKLGEYETMALTAPVAWQELKQRIIDEIEQDNGPQGLR